MLTAMNFMFVLFFSTFIIGLIIAGFFLFDGAILNGYFKKKLQKRFDVNNV